MFGYVLPVKAEMKMRDFEEYRSLYCGVCKQLGQTYGQASRFLLNYDLVLLALLADAVSGEAGEVRCEGCFANPVSRRKTRFATKGLGLGAAGLVMLSHHKLLDNAEDEAFPKSALYKMLGPASGHMYRRAAKAYPELAGVFETQMARQRALEARGCADADEVCEPTAKMCAALFAAAGGGQQKILHRLGLFCGQVVYLLDAAEDFEEDAARGRFNVYRNQGLDKAGAVQAVQRRCRMAAGEIALCYNLLTIRQYRPILDNIFFLGLPAGINMAGTKRSKRRAPHGQIESV